MNLNKVYIIGRLTQDPELRSTPSGQSVATIRMATNRVWNDPNTREKKEATEYHTVVAWGRLGEIANQYAKKGALLMIEGRLQTRSWAAQDGSKRYATEIIAEGLQLGPRSGDMGGSSFGGGSQPRSNSFSKPASQKAPVSDEPEIPIIDENELTTSGIEEQEIKDVDLPF